MAIAGVMTKFKISELSGVDRPAQSGARATIMKRDYTADERKAAADAGEAMPDGSFPIKTKDDLKNAVQSHGRAADPAKAKTHIIARAKALGATDQLPDDWEVKKADPGHHDGQGVPMSNAIKKALGLADTATDTEVEAAIIKLASSELKEANAKLAKAESDLALANKIAKMAPAVREHYEVLLKADKKKDAEDLADMGADDAMEKVKKLAAGDETVVIEGRTISKRAVGEDMFAVMKSQAARIDASAAEIKKARDETAQAGFAKRATEEFGHLAGTPDERASVLKFLDAAPTEVKTAAEAIFKAAEGHAKFAFSRAGAGGGKPAGDGDTAEEKLTKLAKEYEKSHSTTPGMTFAKAYDAVAQANPQLYEEVINPSAD